MDQYLDTKSVERPPSVIITSEPDLRHYWRDLWAFRELLVLLVWRDLVVRYKQTVLGVAWAVIRPVITVVVFSVVFGTLAKLPSGDTPYVLLVFAGMLPWQFFATSFADAGNSIVGNAHIISKVYFPRLLIPIASVVVCVVDALISGLIFVALMAWYGVWPTWQVVFLPLFLIWLILIVLAGSLWVASLNVRYRDFRYVVPFMLQLGTYMSPVGFSSAIIPEQWRSLYYLNPMVGVIDGFRWCLFGSAQPLNLALMLPSMALTLLLLIPGLRFFRKTEDAFADWI
jgi:lipopolysaccharide transport system permease protein